MNLASTDFKLFLAVVSHCHKGIVCDRLENFHVFNSGKWITL